MRWRMRSTGWVIACLAWACTTIQAEAAIYFIDTTVNNPEPKTALTNLGYTVVSGGTLSDYSAYEQVWDRRYDQVITASDAAAFTDYLQGGGRMFLTGEHTGFPDRNNSLISFLNSVGAGTVDLTSNTFSSLQTFTTEGQAVNPLGTYAGIYTTAGLMVTESSPGFMITETAAGSGKGSLVGWDFGDILGSESARMIVGFDTTLSGRTTSGSLHTAIWGNFAQYLDDPAPTNAAVPEPATFVIWGLGLAAAAAVRVAGSRRAALGSRANS